MIEKTGPETKTLCCPFCDHCDGIANNKLEAIIIPGLVCPDCTGTMKPTAGRFKYKSIKFFFGLFDFGWITKFERKEQ